MEAAETIRMLDLEPHPKEGGFFAETYRSGEILPAGTLDERYEGPRCASTAIYYLLTPDTFSAIHRLQSDEVFHFYLGDTVEMLHLHPGGKGRVVTIGTNLDQGEKPQAVVPRGVWQGARLKPGGRFALLGCTVAPGFDYADYEHGDRESLLKTHGEFRERILALTND